MKRKTLALLCITALLLTGCSNTASTIASDSSDSMVSAGGTSAAAETAPAPSAPAEAVTSEPSPDNASPVTNEPTSEPPQDQYTLEVTGPTLESPANESDDTPSEPGNAYYDQEFKGTIHSIGAPMSYEDVMAMLKVGEAEHGEYIDSFFLVETVKALSTEECRELAGWSADYSDRTIYKVNVLKDLVSGEDVSRTEYIFVSMGNIQQQETGDPIYAPGEKFTVVLTKPQDGCDFLRTPGSFMFRYDAVEAPDGSIELYARNNPIDAGGLNSAEEISDQAITSTTLNPANHTQKISLTKLAEFIRTDWQERGVPAALNDGE